MIKAAIVGGTGYTGVELLRILAQHPEVRLEVITSRQEVGLKVCDMFPNLRGRLDISFSDPISAPISECDVAFFATPNGIAMKEAPALLKKGLRIIDLAADFRIQDIATWEKWYGVSHASPELVKEAVYGLPEVNREKIKGAKLIANPGCYATAVQLGFLPLIEAGVVDTSYLIADAKSGVSGAGRKAEVATLFAEAADNFKAYAMSGHRHLPEIVQGLQAHAHVPIKLTFVPHLLPTIRGIEATLYAKITKDADFQSLFEKRYATEHFVDVLAPGSHPEIRSVRGANHCRIAIHRPQNADIIVISSVIDNLVKGAAGQAVQNMNIMFGLDEQAGLTQIPLLP